MSNTRRKDWLPGGTATATDTARLEMFGFSPGQARLGQQALKRRVVMRQLVVIAGTDNTSDQRSLHCTGIPSVTITTLLCVWRAREDSFPHYCEVGVACYELPLPAVMLWSGLEITIN